MSSFTGKVEGTYVVVFERGKHANFTKYPLTGCEILKNIWHFL